MPEGPTEAERRPTQDNQPGARSHSRYLAAFLSLLLPGVGQLYQGKTRLGLLLAGAVVGMAVAGVWLWLQGPSRALSLLVQPRVLLVLLFLDALLLALRLFAVIEASGVTKPRSGFGLTRHVFSYLALALVVVVVGAPHAAAGYYDVLTYRLVTTVFASSPRTDQVATALRSAPSPSPTLRATPTATRMPSPGAPAVDSPAPAAMAIPASPSPSPSPTSIAPTPAPPAPGRLNFLLVGGDAGPERAGLRTDTMIVVSVDPGLKRAAIFGIPRNLVGTPLPAELAASSYDGTFAEPLNALYGYGRANPQLFPDAADPGLAALQAAIQELLGLPIQHYVLVDLQGFVRIIDALGGVTLDVPREIEITLSPPETGESWQYYDILPGRQHLDGHESLAYVRSREGSSDYDRMLRQR